MGKERKIDLYGIRERSEHETREHGIEFVPRTRSVKLVKCAQMQREQASKGSVPPRWRMMRLYQHLVGLAHCC